MDEEEAGLWWRQAEHLHGNFWQIFCNGLLIHVGCAKSTDIPFTAQDMFLEQPSPEPKHSKWWLQRNDYEPSVE